MERIVHGPGGEVWIDVQSGSQFTFRSPFEGADFVLMLVDGVGVTGEEQHALSAEIVRQGCRYAVCAGHGCSSWDDSIDYAHLQTDPDFNPPDDRFVMTTWHEDWDASKVVEWFLNSTTFGDFTPERFLVMLLGATREAEEEIRIELARRS